MAALMIAFIAFLLVILLVVLFTRVLKIEKEVTIIKPADDAFPDLFMDGGAAAGKQEEEPEIINLVDYFHDGHEEKKEELEEGKEKKEEKEKSKDSGEGGKFSATDKLTDLKKGRGYLVECKKKLEEAKDEGHIYCAAYFDYDRFRFLNNLKGAASSDYVLTQTAIQCRRIFPENSMITRISCDHFVVVFPLVDLALFDEYYEQLRRMCDKIRGDIAVKGGMRLSVGFATTDNDSSYDVSVLISRANVARHCAKVTKAEKFETYDETMCSSGFFGDTLMENYSDCQYGDEFTVYFETQLDLVSQKIIGCDTFVRWNYEVSSDGAVAVSQETGRIPTNNEKVVYQACRALSRWRKAGREAVPTLVELPVTDLFKADVDDFIGKCLMEFQVEPTSLIIKIDVGIVRLDWYTCSKQIKRIKELGVKVCVFNMDAGYSHLEFLSGLSVDYVKLHRSFVRGIESSQEQLGKCRKIIDRAGAIGAQVIFEGVDSVEQATALRSIHARTIVQGRYTGRPASVDEISRILPEHIERKLSESTVILDESDFAKGNYDLF